MNSKRIWYIISNHHTKLLIKTKKIVFKISNRSTELEPKQGRYAIVW
jgi:hypothetical protein